MPYANGVTRTASGLTEKQEKILLTLLRLVEKANAEGRESIDQAIYHNGFTPSAVGLEAGLDPSLASSWFTAGSEALRRDKLVRKESRGLYFLTDKGLNKAVEATGRS